MLHFSKLKQLDHHLLYLSDKLGNKNIFAVGGCIRDILLGLDQNPLDIDATLSGDPKKIFQNIDTKDISLFMTEKFGTITMIPKDNKKLQYEITPFRKESNYNDKRHPETIERTNSLIEDVKRREFTMSALYYFTNHKDSIIQKENTMDLADSIKFLDKQGYTYIFDANIWIIQDETLINNIFPDGIFKQKQIEHLIGAWNKINKGNKISKQNSINIVIDNAHGIQDMLDGRLKAIGEPDQRFQEDALRIVRALRFINTINYKLSVLQKKGIETIKYLDIEKGTWKSLQKNFYQIPYIAKERIKIELDKVFKSGNPFGFIALLDEINILQFIFPAVHRMKHVDQPIRYHPFDTYHHTLMTLYHVQSISTNPLVRYAMLYHDVGKVDQYYLYKLGLSRDEITKLSELNHRNTSGQIAKKDFRALGFSNKEIDEIKWYIDNHHKPEEILSSKENKQIKKMRKLLSEAGIQRIHNLFDVVLGDRLGHYNPIQPPETQEIYTLIKMADELHANEGQFTMKDLAISGDDIIGHFKQKPGPQIGEMLRSAFERAINNIKERNKKATLLKYLESTYNT